jgi:DNA-binding FadR family transcriptional regulator
MNTEGNQSMATRVPAYRQAQLEIKRFIEVNRLGMGDPLPPEAVLAKELGISRPSLREGMKALESLGIVESRHGEGVFVAPFSFDTIIENLPYSIVADGKSLYDLLQVRAAIELGVVTQVVDRISPQDKARLRELAERMVAAAKEGRDFEQEDGEFHATMYRCLDNPFLSRLIDLFWRVFHRLNQSDTAPDHWALESTAQDHLRIAEVIDRGDKAALLEEHQKHFRAIFSRLQQAASQGTAAQGRQAQALVQQVAAGGLDLAGRLERLNK